MILNFVRFARPHTVIGTTLSILALYAIAFSYSDQSDFHISELIITLGSCLAANIYIVGLNQLTDIEIDRINKPYLPLASGAWTIQRGRTIIVVCLLASIVLAIFIGKWLLVTVLSSLALGTAYSLPPFRLKRFYFWAAFCILAVRGFIVNIFLFLNFNWIINGSDDLPFVILLLTGVIFIYSIAIAWFKDLPDDEGDKKFNISTLTVEMGRKKIFKLGMIMLSLAIMFTIGFAPLMADSINQPLFIGGHAIILIFFWIMAKRVDLNSKTSIAFFYQCVWGMYFAEYALFAFSVY